MFKNLAEKKTMQIILNGNKFRNRQKKAKYSFWIEERSIAGIVQIKKQIRKILDILLIQSKGKFYNMIKISIIHCIAFILDKVLPMIYKYFIHNMECYPRKNFSEKTAENRG